MKFQYTPRINPDTERRDYRLSPINLLTLRASVAVEKELGCPYVVEVANRIAAHYGRQVAPGRAHDLEGTIFSYLAYAANQARTAIQSRRRLRRLLKAGWRWASELTSSQVGEAYAFRTPQGPEFIGKVKIGPNGLGCAKLRVRKTYLPFSSNEFLYRDR